MPTASGCCRTARRRPCCRDRAMRRPSTAARCRPERSRAKRSSGRWSRPRRRLPPRRPGRSRRASRRSICRRPRASRPIATSASGRFPRRSCSPDPRRRPSRRKRRRLAIERLRLSRPNLAQANPFRRRRQPMRHDPCPRRRSRPSRLPRARPTNCFLMARRFATRPRGRNTRATSGRSRARIGPSISTWTSPAPWPRRPAHPGE